MSSLGYALADRIQRSFESGQMVAATVYGEWGIGKSVYALRIVSALNPDLPFSEILNRFVLYKTEEIVKTVGELYMQKKRIPALVIDDAGLAFYAMDYHRDSVKSAMKWLNVARTNIGGVIFTTPTPSMMVRKVRNFEGMLTGKVVRASGKDRDARTIKLYRSGTEPWGKSWSNWVIQDDFNARLPDEDFALYQSKRNEMVGFALEQMRRALDM